MLNRKIKTISRFPWIISRLDPIITGLKVVKGSRFLGGCIGCEVENIIFVKEKISNKTQNIDNLAMV